LGYIGPVRDTFTFTVGNVTKNKTTLGNATNNKKTMGNVLTTKLLWVTY